MKTLSPLLTLICVGALASCERSVVVNNYYGPVKPVEPLTPEQLAETEMLHCQWAYNTWVREQKAAAAFEKEYGFLPAERGSYPFPKVRGEEIFPGDLAAESPFVYEWRPRGGMRGDFHRDVVSWRWKNGPVRLADR